MKRLPATALALVVAVALSVVPLYAQSGGGSGAGGNGAGGSGTGSGNGTSSSDVQPAPKVPLAPSETLQSTLYAVGSLGSSNLYFLYVALGMLGDSYAKSLYDAKTTTSLIGNLSDLANLAKSSLSDLLKQPVIQANDQDAIAQMTDAYDLLLKQADGLQSYVDKTDDGTIYQEYRKKAWAKISDVLGLSNPSGAANGSGSSSGSSSAGSGASGNGSSGGSKSGGSNSGGGGGASSGQ